MAPAPPTESQILQSYLLHPSPLSAVIPYSTFQTLAPSSSARRNPELKSLYRDLQFQRDITIDDVRRRINDECRRSMTLVGRLRREIRREEGERQRPRKRKRARGEQEDRGSVTQSDEDSLSSDDEAEAERRIETHLHGPLGNTLPTDPSRHNHTTTSLISAMAAATEDLDSEIASLEAELASTRTQCEEHVGNLSDLRYGRFAQNRGSGQGAGRGGDGSTEDSVEKAVVHALEDLKARLARESNA